MVDIHPISRYLSYEQRKRAAERRYSIRNDGTLRTIGNNCPLGEAVFGYTFDSTPTGEAVYRELAGIRYPLPIDEDAPSLHAAGDWIMKNDTGLIRPEDVAPMLGVGPDGQDLLA